MPRNADGNTLPPDTSVTGSAQAMSGVNLTRLPGIDHHEMGSSSTERLPTLDLHSSNWCDSCKALKTVGLQITVSNLFI